MRNIFFSAHAKKGMSEPRQRGITRQDVLRACYRSKEIRNMPMDEPWKLEGFVARSGRKFSIVVTKLPKEGLKIKEPSGLKIITVIGGEWGKYHGVRSSKDSKRSRRNRKQIQEEARLRKYGFIR